MNFPAPTVPELTLATLTAKERARLHHLQPLLEQLTRLRNAGHTTSAAAKIIAADPASRTSWQTLNNLYPHYTAQGWRGIVRTYTTPTAKLPEPTLDYWHRLCLANQRAVAPAYTHLLAQWQAWRQGDTTAAIPGLKTPPPPTGTGEPLGLTRRTLYRHAPSKRALAATRRGREAALSLLPPVLTTRATLESLYELQFDDAWHDILAIIPGQNAPRRILQFGCIDVASAFAPYPSLKPRTLNDDDIPQHLNETDFLYYLLGTLSTLGYRTTGTILRLEHGTTTISRPLEDILATWSEGALRVERSGIHRAPALPGQYRSPGKGNPRAKALKESHHYLLHNILASIRGQTGIHRQDAPAEAAEMIRHDTRLLQIAAHLPPDLADQLRTAHPSLAHYRRAVEAAHDLLNTRTHHRMEGFDQIELLRARPTEDWTPATDYPGPIADALRQLAARDPRHRTTRPATPAEQFRARLDPTRHATLSPLALVDLLPPTDRRPATIRRGMVTFSDLTLAPGPLHYIAQLPGDRLLPEDSTWHILPNPYDLTHLILIDPSNGRALGLLPAHHAAPRQDREALMRQVGLREKLFAAELADAARHVTHRQDTLTHNTAVLRQHNRTHTTPAPKSDTRVRFAPTTAAATPSPFDPANLLND